MELPDYSPPEFPTVDEQRAALQKGLGRAMLWATRDRLNRKFLLEACLTDKRYDHQCEPLRGAWLWELMQTVGAEESFRTPIWEALHSLESERNGPQLSQLAGYYAAQGDVGFLQLLRMTVERPDKGYGIFGEDELIAADGEAGLLLVLRAHGKRLAQCDWEWTDGRVVSDAQKRFGDDVLDRLLQGTADASLQRFREGWLANPQSDGPLHDPESYRAKMRSYSAQDVLAADRRISLTGWGRHADDDQLAVVADAICRTQDAEILKRLLMTFGFRALPELNPRFFELTTHDDWGVRCRTFKALGQTAHPEVRRFALANLATAQQDGVIELFAKNFRPGDEERILAALDVRDNDEWHHLLFDVRGVLKENENADVSRLGLVAYAESPCEMCRTSALELLLRQSAAPLWLIEECKLDCSDETWELATSIS